MSKYKSSNTKAWCCIFHSKVRKTFRSLPKEKQAEILKNIFKKERTMTREEAITRLHWLKRELIKGTDMNEPIDMAIEALSKPIVDITQRDLCADISCTDCPFMQETCKLMDYVASAEAVQGEWDSMIADGSDGSHWYEYECSHCGEIVLRPYNFCPNCGARMKGGDSE